MSMQLSVYHIMVLWSNAVGHKEYVLRDLKESGFFIYKVFNVHWTKKHFLDNYVVFYAHSQKHLSYEEYLNLLRGKMEHCGDGDFVAIVLRDDAPTFEERKTSSGVRKVNTRIFDKKTQYRALTGGGHKIHSSDDAWETNKDLTLMFGFNTKDFLKQYESSEAIERLEKDCLGVGGYKSIQDLFYVLNNTVQYVVMRNFECLPDEYTVKDHGDIDLLVENLNYVRYLTLAKPVFPEPYRVYHEVQIAGKAVPFDFRYVGDGYYDRPWQEDILMTRLLNKNLFYVPNDENMYHSLLYHAYVQKWNVKDDYKPRLSGFAKKIGLDYYESVSDSIHQLDSFLNKKEYEYVKPQDKSVVYNEDNLSNSSYAFRYGKFIKRNSVDDGTLQFFSNVYEKPDSFVKIGTDWLILNECKYLKLLNGYINSPYVISCEVSSNKGEAIMEISRSRGVDFCTFFSDVNHQRRTYLVSFIVETLKILKELNRRGVVHRDLTPSNLIIEDCGGKCSVSLIDFAWATEKAKILDKRPANLCGRYVSYNKHTDAFSFGMLLLDYWCDLPSVRYVSSILRTICDFDSQEEVAKKLKKALRIAMLIFTPYDEWRLLCRRHLRIGWTYQRIKRIFVL